MQGITKTIVVAVLGLAVSAGLDTTSASAQEVFDVSAVAEKPRIASPMAAQRAIAAAYPQALQSARVSGRVLLRFVVKPDGKVDPSSIEVQQSDHEGLADAARGAVMKIEFVPGRMSGSAVPTRVVFPISFKS